MISSNLVYERQPSPSHPLVQRRIERSQELLIHTGESLVDIADQAGFADQAAFTRTFHQIVGISPGRWRRDHQRR